MTPPTRSDSILAGPHSLAVLAVTLAALALFGAVAASGPAVAQPDRPTVVVTDATTSAGGTTTVGVVLTSAPDGLSGYYLEVALGAPDVATVESVDYPDQFALTTDPEIGDQGDTVVLEAADMEGAIDPGATSVTLATITIAGVAPGEAELTVDPRQFDADDGSAVRPATGTGVVTVGDDGTADAGGTGPDDGERTERTDDGSDVGTGTDDDTTTGTLPFPTPLVLVAFLAFAVIALVRRD
ncbi:hypothetical protein [Halobaculum lipolyticum]|uniref:PGF-CTERM protein n=1 Tax=Halobaculum lipolyticum TaxID=3032001 RepID=A0ABD5WEJ0_9EURY|nr:hypothetical protein [Halobaculum sp. DT31]